MDKCEIIAGLEEFGFTYDDGYLTLDKCFSFEGCGCYPLTLPNWENAEAFLRVLRSINN